MTAAGVSMLAVAMLLLGGCGGGEQSGAAEVVDPVAQSATVDLPRSVTYGDWKWTVENATAAGGLVTLDVTVENFLDENFSGEVTLEDLSLLDGNGVAAAPAGSGARQLDLDVPPGGRSNGTLAFEVDDDFSLATASFRIAQPDAAPAVLPFNGEQPDHYPVDIDLRGKPRKGSGSPSSTTFMFEPLAATAHLDASGVRVSEDSRWLTVTLRVTGQDSNRAGGLIGPQTVRLVADGNPIEARLAPNETVRPGEEVELDYLFELPLDAAKVRLRVGDASDGSKQNTIPLDLPDLP